MNKWIKAVTSFFLITIYSHGLHNSGQSAFLKKKNLNSVFVVILTVYMCPFLNKVPILNKDGKSTNWLTGDQ